MQIAKKIDPIGKMGSSLGIYFSFACFAFIFPFQASLLPL